MKREGETKQREVGGKKEGDERKEANGGIAYSLFNSWLRFHTRLYTRYVVTAAT